jgi:NTP pyrophosphatase (non-canonical NTP hydrolase)
LHGRRTLSKNYWRYCLCNLKGELKMSNLKYYQISHLVGGLSFRVLRCANNDRAKQSYSCGDWTPNDWMTALAGEVGEAANFLKKVRRGDCTMDDARKNIANELADVQTYLDLLASACGIDLEKAVCDKWDAVAKKVHSPIRIGPYHG